MTSDNVSIEHAHQLRGVVRVPGDKSTSHRALMISALADGTSRIEGLSTGNDVASSAMIMEQLGAHVERDGSVVFVTGPEEGLRAAIAPLDCGNSGTTMRLLTGLVSSIHGDHDLVGDASLSQRPMDRVAIPLELMGALVQGRGKSVTAPLHVQGRSTLRAIDYHVPHASAQVKSSILFAGLVAQGVSSVLEDVRTRSTTEDMFRSAGINVESDDVAQGRRVTLHPGRPEACHWTVPGDPSQAAFFCVLGAVHRDAVLNIIDIDASPERTGFVGVLQRMGATIESEHRGTHLSLAVSSSALVATEIHSREIPSVDEVPILVVAASAATGVSAFRQMNELRIKESDRFEGSMELSRRLGCRVWSDGDDFFVEGIGGAEKFSTFEIDAELDHRMVMAAAVAGSAGSGCRIAGSATVASSYPHFFGDLAALQ
jgi:3-phosphoshikimate 1-carboxyvinyltransferase